jgi:hypothetical protein
MHPLMQSDLSSLTDSQLEDKVKELTKKYFTALQISPTVSGQVLMLLEEYKNEQDSRQSKHYQSLKNDGKDFDDLINIG